MEDIDLQIIEAFDRALKDAGLSAAYVCNNLFNMHASGYSRLKKIGFTNFFIRYTLMRVIKVVDELTRTGHLPVDEHYKSHRRKIALKMIVRNM